MSTKPLFDEFAAVSAKQWKQKIQADLRGADYNDSLVWESPEGIKVKPFYHADDQVTTYKNLTSNSTWKIGQSIYAGNAKAGNTDALAQLNKGAEAVYVTLPSRQIEPSEVLRGIDLRATPVYFDMRFLSAAYVAKVYEFAAEADLQIHLMIDPIGNLARSGNWYVTLEKDFAELDVILELGHPNAIGVDVALYQNAGANRVQQLAYALAHANEYLNHRAGKGASTLTFEVAVGGNYFFEIAKLRALRLLYASLAREYGLAQGCHILAKPSRRNKTVYDYNTNMLRTTTEAMASVLGGADTVVNLPYDAIYHKNNEFASRNALNQLLLLKNESYFDKVANASDGAYYIESLTQQLAEKALVLFKSIEGAGGFLKQLKAHTIQRKIAESAQKEQKSFDRGEIVLVGTNRYQNDNDRMKETIELYPFLKTKPRKTVIPPVLEKRLSEAMEQKRLENE